MRVRLLLLVASLVSLVWVSAVCAEDVKKAGGGKKIVLTPDEIQWKDGPPQIPGSKMALLDGDPKKRGMFVARLKLPAGTKIPTHYHGNVERVTVLSGKVNLAMGATADNPVALPAGSYFSIPPKTVHNAWVDEETVLQLTSTGPWSMHVQKGAQKGKPAE